jgi:hypothetical protein
MPRSVRSDHNRVDTIGWRKGDQRLGHSALKETTRAESAPLPAEIR